jgi:phosphoglycolate phosphatase-like HAD superfamily hydrolase
MNKKIILFDIDRTILDTEVLGENVYKNIAAATQKTINEIEIINQDYKNGLESKTDFDPDIFLKKVADKTGVSLDTLNQAMFKAKNFVLYPNVLEVLKKLSQKRVKLGIYSEGVLEWQRKKIILTEILGYFDTDLVFIERRKLSPESISKIPYGVMVIDDKKEVIETLKQLRKDLRLVWINRIDDEKIDGVITIQNLTEVSKFIQ